MSRGAYYNEIDAFCCDVLRARIADGSLPPGHVDERDIRAVNPDELRDYGQVHLFAGIGGGGLACRLAGVPDDFRIITAGVPCQPASQAGKRLGAADERWLWPEFFRVLRGLRSHCALVEQPPGIASLNAGREWRWILGELAEIVPSYEVSRVSAQAVGAPQERERIWIVADADSEGRLALRESGRTRLEGARGRLAQRRSEGLADTDGDDGRLPGRRDEGQRSNVQAGRPDAEGRSGSIGDRDGGRCEQHHAQLGNDLESGAGHVSMGDTAESRLGVRRPVESGAVWNEARRSESERRGGEVGEPVGHSVQHGRIAGHMAGPASTDEGEGLQRERRGRAAWNSGDGIRAWDDAVPVRGADGTVRLIPKEAAEAGPESPLWPVADGLPGRVARLRAIGNAWVPQAAVPALRVILARYANEASA